MGSTDLAYSKNVNLKVSVRLSFQGFPLFLHTEKSEQLVLLNVMKDFLLIVRVILQR